MISPSCVLALLPLLTSARPWCAGSSLEEPLLTSDLVLAVSLVSRSRVVHGQYDATFRVDKILHSKDSDLNSKYLRLKLETKSGESGESEDSRCSFTTKVKPNNKYLVMVNKEKKSRSGVSDTWSSTSYSLTLPPLKFTRKLVGEVQRILCPLCKDSQRRQKRVRVRRGKSSSRTDTNTRLSCSARGNPPPTLYWTMDGKIVRNSHETRIITKNLSKFLKKSVLKLKPSITNRSLKLQCHAYNEYGHTSKVKMTKPVKKKTKPRAAVRGYQKLKGLRGSHFGFKPRGLSRDEERGGLWSVPASPPSPLYSSQCPIADYCLNGGRCHYYSIIGELTCQCEKGYHGQRCERKYVWSGLEGPRMSDKFPMCLLGIAHYPCQPTPSR